MLEAVELYGVAYAKDEEGRYSTYIDEHDGNTCRVEISKEDVAEEPWWRIDMTDVLGQSVRIVPTLDRAAMIVALLARPDAQFELVEKSDA